MEGRGVQTHTVLSLALEGNLVEREYLGMDRYCRIILNLILWKCALQI